MRPDCDEVWGVGVPVIAHLLSALIHEAKEIEELSRPLPILWPSSTIIRSQLTLSKEHASSDVAKSSRKFDVLPFSSPLLFSRLSLLRISSSNDPFFHSLENRLLVVRIILNIAKNFGGGNFFVAVLSTNTRGKWVLSTRHLCLISRIRRCDWVVPLYWNIMGTLSVQ